ncbi:site-specific integrase [Elizabethkingia anophelis]|uniref:tyrosine-type recombinase/integrase n=1 Tax=Elizabethkingia anophelis TaxID=1117645 RepID=UPI0011AF2ADC|nr:site-specific integrase [Elizabethkingia anophelis]MCT3760858.1 site-specific integrase [Elizabethkingia anophelis]MCT3975264.1 site-specific integrase [Elizabethkingia anophelis]
MDYKITLVLDTRRATKDGTYPTKLRVYDTIRKKTKLYNINKYYSEEEYENIISKKPARKNLVESIYLEAIKAKAEEIAKNISIFNFKDFENQFFNKQTDKNNIIDYYNDAIKEYTKNDQIKTASNYNSSLKSIQKFINNTNPQKVTNFHVLDINVKWLNNYEQYMLKNGRSYSTIGIYLRPLRALFNKAVAENPSYSKYYPFEKGKYEIPSTQNVKKALNKGDLRKLYNAIPKNEQQQIAKDFWFFSYACNGMNINDIALLKFKNISSQNDKLVFFRGKTKKTRKGNLKEISVILTPFSKAIIEKYKKQDKSKEDYIFSIINLEDSVIEQKKKIDNFIRFINQHIKNLATENEITGEISTYWARHSFSTAALNSGANVEFISESLGHSDIKTTKAYLSGFDDTNKETIISKVTDFL